LVGRAWAKRCDESVLRLSTQAGRRRFSYFLCLITRWFRFEFQFKFESTQRNLNKSQMKIQLLTLAIYKF
jgi:hypothetical protein